MFTHVVLFWFKPDAPEAARQQVVGDCHELLKSIPGVQSLSAGRPAMTPRDVVDNSYDVGLCVILPDSAAHDAYQVHDLHRKFIDRNRQYWEKIRVFDFA